MSAPPKLRPASRISAEEWIVRRDLAAAYRLAALYGWEDMGGTHISARVAGEEAFLINPYELLFEEITASSLVKVDLAGNILGATEYTINPAGFVVQCDTPGETRSGLRDAPPHSRRCSGFLSCRRYPAAEPGGDADIRPNRLSRL
jgi:hypothetical protein